MEDNFYQNALQDFFKALDLCRNSGNHNAYLCNEKEITTLIDEVYHKDFVNRFNRVEQLYRDKKYDEAIYAVDELLAFQKKYSVRSSYDTPRLRSDIINDKYGYLFNLARLNANNKNYEAGILAGERAKSFLKSYRNEINSDLGINDLIIDCYTQLLKRKLKKSNSFLTASKRAFENNSIESATSKIETSHNNWLDAVAFYEKNQSNILDARNLYSLEKQILEQKFKCFYLLSERKLNNRQLDEALSLAQKAQNLQRNNSEKINISTDYPINDLIEKIEFEHYLILVEKGDLQNNLKNFDEALRFYEEARIIETEYNFVAQGKDKNLEPKIKSSAKSSILQEAKRNSNNTNNTFLKNILLKFQDKATKYNVSDDAEITAVLGEIRDKICKNTATILLTNKINEIKRFAHEKNYIQAKNVYQTN